MLRSRCFALVRNAVWLIALSLTLAGCAEPAGDALRFGLSNAPRTLDPRFATDATSVRINRLLYSRLVDFDPSSRPVPALAQWERLSPTHYRFHLSDTGRIFHDGSRLSAEDVKATYDYILDPAHASPHRGALSLIESIEVQDPDTVDFLLSRADPLFPGYLVVGILPARLMAQEHPFARDPVGSGPFRFEGWPEEGRLRLSRSADGQPFELITVPDPTVRVLKLLRGEIDLLQNDLPPELIRYLGEQPVVYLQRHDGSNFTYLGFNMQDPVTGDLRVRQAVAHAIDREAIIRYLWGGAARPAEALLPPEHWAGTPGLTAYRHDPEQARALLAQAGYGPGKPVTLVYKTSADPFRVRLATIIQQQLADVGIRVDLRSYDWGTFYGDIKAGRFQMYSLSWVGIKTPDIFRYVFHSASIPPQGANRGRYINVQVDALIEAADENQDLAERADEYRRLTAKLHEDLPYVPLWYEDHFYAARRDVTGYQLAADGNYDGLLALRRVEYTAVAASSVTP